MTMDHGTTMAQVELSSDIRSTIASVGRNNKRKNTCVWCTWRLSLKRKMNQPSFFTDLKSSNWNNIWKSAHSQHILLGPGGPPSICLRSISPFKSQAKTKKSKQKSRVANFHPPNFTLKRNFFSGKLRAFILRSLKSHHLKIWGVSCCESDGPIPTFTWHETHEKLTKYR